MRPLSKKNEGEFGKSSHADNGVGSLVKSFWKTPEKYRHLTNASVPLPEALDVFLSEFIAKLDSYSDSGGEKTAGETASWRNRGSIKIATFFFKKVLLADGADHYRVLGLKRDATFTQIEHHYRVLLRAFLLGEANVIAQDCIYRIRQAYFVLRNQNRRQAYDRLPYTREHIPKDDGTVLRTNRERSPQYGRITRDRAKGQKSAPIQPKDTGGRRNVKPWIRLVSRKLPRIENLQKPAIISAAVCVGVLGITWALTWASQKTENTALEGSHESVMWASKTGTLSNMIGTIERVRTVRGNERQGDMGNIATLGQGRSSDGVGSGTEAGKASGVAEHQAREGSTSLQLPTSDKVLGGERESPNQPNHVALLLTKAKHQINNWFLTSPKGNSAVETYREVLAVDPNNSAALEGLALIANRYAFLAERHIRSREYNKALADIARGLSVVPNHTTLLRLRRQMQPTIDREHKRTLEGTKDGLSTIVASSDIGNVSAAHESVVAERRTTDLPTNSIVSPKRSLTDGITKSLLDNGAVSIEEMKMYRAYAQLSTTEVGATANDSVDPNTAATMGRQQKNAVAAKRRGEEKALYGLITDFIGVYERGELDRFMTLFTDDVQTNHRQGKQEVRLDYHTLFTKTTVRDMKLNNIVSTRSGQDAVIKATYALMVLKVGETEPRFYKGDIDFRVRGLDKPQIYRLYHSQERTDGVTPPPEGQ